MRVLWLLLLLTPTLPAAGNWPWNGGAELGAGGWGNVAVTGEDVFSGRYSFKAVPQQESVAVTSWFTMPVRAGREYRFSVWCRSAGKAPATLSITVVPGTGGQNRVILADTAAPEEWTLLAGSWRAVSEVDSVYLKLTVKGTPKESAVLLDDIGCNLPPVKSVVPSLNHAAALVEDADLGHELDKSYYDAGTRIDLAVFDLEELLRQGKEVPEELLRDARAASASLREEWLKLVAERENFWLRYSRSNPDNGSWLPFREKNVAFGERAKALADKIEQQCAASRRGLACDKAPPGKRFPDDRFLLALDVESQFYGASRLKHPGNYMNFEYCAKACTDLGVDWVTLLLSPDRQGEALTAFERYCHAPFLIWGSDASFRDGDIISFKYFNAVDQLRADLGRFVEPFRKYPSFAGVQIDEPFICDRNSQYGQLQLEEEWRRYLDKRRSRLEQNQVADPKNTVEWKLFKAEFLARHTRKIYDILAEQGLRAATGIMNKNSSDPSECSYVAFGRTLPFAGTDLYENGSVSESFALSLFKNSMRGRAIFIPGAGYSCKTADSFKRSISTGIVHADGLHMWTSTYAWKYRDPNFFWRFGGSEPNLDDRNRLNAQNWYPWLWDVMRERYHFAARNGTLLARRESLAQTAVVLSERTLLAERAKPYWETNLACYTELIRRHIPVDACFIESMTESDWKRYRVIVAPGMRVLTPEEREQIARWTADGGKLLTTADFAACDEWGRPRSGATPPELTFPPGRFAFKSTGIPADGLCHFLTPKASALLLDTIRRATDLPCRVVGLPEGVEVQFQKNAEGKILVQLLDFVGERTVSGHRLVNERTREQRPLAPFRIHDMVVVP